MTDPGPEERPEWNEEPYFGVDDLHPVFAPESPENANEDGYNPVFQSVETFATTPEATARGLLGSTGEPLLPVGGILLMYGDGGAGKTTMTLDAIAHLASGEDWLEIEVPEAVRATLVENEGPRGMFRQKLAAKITSWNGHPPWAPNVSILEEPWTRFTLGNDRHREALASHISEHGSELVVMGPLVTLGTVGGGTPDEVSMFEDLLRETQALVGHPFAWWIVHHENKAGDVSGAWERVPDVLVHVQGRGHGRTNLVWQKARWSTSLHGKSVDLFWTEGGGYHVVIETARDFYNEIPQAMKDDGEGWYTAKQLATLISARDGKVREIAEDLVELGVLEFCVGPPGRHASAHCWRVSDSWEPEP